MCLGASNVSFGLPQRHVLNAGFLPMAMAAGLTSAIMSTAEVCVDSGPGVRSAARPRPVGRELDRRAPRAPGARGARRSDRAVSGDRRSAAARARRRARRPGAGRRRRSGSGCASCPTAPRSASRAARRSSTPRAGTGSRSTRPAAATGRARSAGPDRVRRRPRRRRSTRGRSRPTSCATAGGSPAAPARAAISSSRCRRCRPGPKAALVGVGRHVILRPSVQKRHLVLEEPTMEDQRSDLAAGARRDRRPRAARLDRAAADARRRCCARSDFDVTAVVCDEELIDVEPGDTTARRFAIAFDLGTTTVVATLLDLDSGQPAAVRSMLNRQQPYGADVITRISATMMDDGRSAALARARARDAGRAGRRGAAPRAASIRARSTRSPSAAT